MSSDFNENIHATLPLRKRSLGKWFSSDLRTLTWVPRSLSSSKSCSVASSMQMSTREFFYHWKASGRRAVQPISRYALVSERQSPASTGFGPLAKY